MWCPACAWLIEETLARTAGIRDAKCQFDLDRLRCRYDPVQISPRRIAATVSRLGYHPASPEASQTRTSRAFRIRLAVCGLLTMNVMMLSFALYSGFVSHLDAESVLNLSWPIFIMGTIVVGYGGHPLYRRAWGGMRDAAWGMETLVSLGAVGAYGLSLHHFIKGGLHLYFDTAAMLITLVLLGKHLEQNAKARIRRELTEFQQLQPAKVKIIPPGAHQGRYIAAAQLRQGNLFEVAPGEVAPADGTIVHGRGRVDLAALTGEAQPLAKSQGDPIISGSRVIEGTLRIQATRVGQAAVLGQMLAIMENALARKTPVEGRTDKILRGFVPVVILLAMGTAAWLYFQGMPLAGAWLRGVTVLVISCPCALGIAIPLARVAALGVALKQGFLVRDFACFEQLEGIDTIFFDKTGTLTQGRWALSRIETLAAYDRRQLLAWAAALEADASHPVAHQIRAVAQEKHIGKAPWPQARDIVIRDNGVTGTIQGRQVRLGSREFIGAEFPSLPETDSVDPKWDGKPFLSRVYMTVDGAPAAIFEFTDDLRPTAGRTVDQFHTRGMHVVLVSGDDAGATEHVARRLGITECHGGLSPKAKADLITDRQSQGRQIAMVGDGINDAPAMATAQVAFALGTSYDLGREAADVTLMAAVPEQLNAFWALAGQVNRKIHQNLAFSFVYNLLSIPIAMSGWLTPLVAVVAMLMSSLSVIGNTLRLLGSSTGPRQPVSPGRRPDLPGNASES